jgi:recombination protein RecA
VNPNRLRSIIAGSYLGDGCIPKPQTKNSNCYLKVQHGIKQLDYIRWKSNLLGSFATEPIIINRTFKGKPYTATAFQTKVHPFCTRLRKLYDENGHKRVNNVVLSYLDELGLAVWYMDDGSKVTRRYKHVDGTYGKKKFRGTQIAICSFTPNECEIIQEYFNQKWNLDSKVYYSRGKYPKITFLSKNGYKFVDIVKPYIPECMLYKINTLAEDT